MLKTFKTDNYIQLTIPELDSFVFESDFVHFPQSRFTRISRNDYFLELTKKLFNEEIQNSVFLMGSGPLEPFTVSSIWRDQKTKIVAIDNDNEIVSILKKSIKQNRLPIREICIACNTEYKHLFTSNDNLHKKEFKVSKNLNYVNIPKSLVKNIYVELLDLGNEIPSYNIGPKLIFSGFLLINIAKSNNGSEGLRFILQNIRKALKNGGIFASCTSYNFLGKDTIEKNTLFEYLNQLKIRICCGILNEISLSSKGLLSNFGFIASYRKISYSTQDKASKLIYKTILDFIRETRLRLETKNLNILSIHKELKRNDSIVIGFAPYLADIFTVYSVSKIEIINKLNKIYKLSMSPFNISC